jgi:hypothetical protein
MAAPRFLVVDGDNDTATGALLYRFDIHGNCVGDTWHKSLDEAKRQAADEYEGLLDSWEEIPSTIELEKFLSSQSQKIKEITRSKGSE